MGMTRNMRVNKEGKRERGREGDALPRRPLSSTPMSSFMTLGPCYAVQTAVRFLRT